MSDNQPQSTPRFRDMAPMLEFCAWVAVILTPLLRLVNGPPVTDDQVAIQITLTIVVILTALLLRVYNWRTRRKTK